MGNSILRGITAALFVTVITLLAGMLWTALGLGGLTMSSLVDIGLIVSCVTAGYRTGRESGQWLLGGVAGIGYVTLCVTILALFLEVSGWGAIQVLAEGGLIGILAGALGAGGADKLSRTAGSRRPSVRSFAWRDHGDWDSYSGSRYDEGDSHSDEWDDREDEEVQFDNSRDEWKERRTFESEKRGTWEEEVQWSGRSSAKKLKSTEDRFVDEQIRDEEREDEWDSWVRGEKSKPTAATGPASYRKAWWEEDVL